MLLPVLAGLGALSLMSNPRRRRRKARRRNPSTPGGTDSRGTRYKLRKNTETAEWMLVAYVNGKRHEGRTLYFPFDRYDRASVADARKDAENTLAHVTGARSNPTAEWENKSEAQVRADKEGVPFLRTWTGVILRDTPGNRKLVRQNKSTWGGIRDVKRPRRSNPMRIVGARPAISRARAKKIAAEYGVKLPSLGREVMLFKYGRFDTQVWLGNHSGTFVISDHGAIRDPITTEVATKLGIKTNPRRRGRRNPGTISRTSLTDAEAAIGGKALLGSKRSGAWAMSHASAKTFANRLRHGFKVVPSSHAGHDGKQLYLVTDGHWYVG